MTFEEFRNSSAEKIYENCPTEQKDRGTSFFQADCLIKHFSEKEYMLCAKEEIPKILEEKLFCALERKLSGEPLQYILGEWEFYGLRMFCGKGCLIPRPETEFLVEYMIKNLPKNGRFLDLCTGSGCISAAVLKSRPDATCISVDISEDALFYARKNASYHKLDDRMNIVCADLCSYLPAGNFDIIASNPPYIRSCDMKTLSGEVLCEPHIALDGGDDGLFFYRTITERFAPYLSSKGSFAFEVGFDTAQGVKEILSSCGLAVGSIYDYSKIERVITGKKN